MTPRSLQLQDEIAFWKAEIGMVGQFPQYTAYRLRPETRRKEYPEWIEPHLRAVVRRFPGEKLKALDVGSGPLSTLAWAHDQGLMEVQAADPLADEYNAILRQHAIDFPVKPVPVAGERLTTRFAPESFHVVYSQNALDHAEDVQKCFEEIEAVLKPGGLFLLLCHENEGKRERYQGLHQWNFFARRGALHCANAADVNCLNTRRLALRQVHLYPFDSRPFDPDGPNTLLYACYLRLPISLAGRAIRYARKVHRSLGSPLRKVLRRGSRPAA
jgi:SAM-dependent methyltransferase